MSAGSAASAGAGGSVNGRVDGGAERGARDDTAPLSGSERLRPFRHLLPLVRPHRRSIAIGIFAIFATQAAQGVLPNFFGYGIEALEGANPDVDAALRWAAWFLAATACRGVFQWLMRLHLMRVSREMERALRDLLFEKVLRQSPGWVARHHTGDLMSRFTSDVEAVRMSAGPGLMYVLNTLAFLPWALGFMFAISPALAALNLVPLALLAVGTRIVSPRMHSASAELQESLAELSTRAQESFAGVRVVKSFAREEAETAAFRKRSEQTLAASLRVAYVQAVFWPMIGLLKWLGLVLTILAGGGMMARGELSLGEFLIFHTYAGLLLWPMVSLGWVLALWERGKVAMARLAAILEAPREIDDPADPVHVAAPDGSLELRGLTFAYPGAAAPALSDVSFRVAPGRTVALVGPTGAGKSTLLATLLRLLDPPPGTVLVDGVPVERRSLRELRARIGYVPQDTFLFSDTVGANVSLGLPAGDAAEPSVAAAADGAAAAAGDPRVRDAAARARVLEDVERLPDGFATMLGERGVNLSGGQRQRTAIARALVRDPPILLLDDCLSAVDAKTESEILENLREVLRGRTTLLVTHRVSAARLADEVVVLDEGRVVQQGAPQDLLAREGLFARLARRQSLEEALEAA